LLDLFAWSEEDFLKRTEGSAIRRTGYCGWLRNIAIALGNGPPDPEVISALYEKKAAVSDMVAEHIGWAIEKLENS
jgi:epoxyqueuosine reductase